MLAALTSFLGHLTEIEKCIQSKPVLPPPLRYTAKPAYRQVKRVCTNRLYINIQKFVPIGSV